MRYQRLEQIAWWRQDLVANARALVAGCGALGNEVVKNLVLLGWGEIVLIDFDVVEASNLTRSVFFASADLGRPKVDVLVEKAARTNPDSRLVGLDGDLRTCLSAGMVLRTDVVFGCLDGVGARLALSQLAGQADRLVIDGALSVWEGTVTVLAGGNGPCYACGLADEDFRHLALRRSCPAYMALADANGGVPTTPTLSSITAAQMVQLALRWLHGQRPPLFPLEHQLRFDAQFDRFWKVKLPRLDRCLLHPEPRRVLADAALSHTDSWRRILDYAKELLHTSRVSLHLPLTLLESWDCPDCGAHQEALFPHVTDRPFSCPKCGETAILRLRNQITGDEGFLDSSPAAMNLPAWSWITATGPSYQEVTLELAGAPANLAHLDRSPAPWPRPGPAA